MKRFSIILSLLLATTAGVGTWLLSDANLHRLAEVLLSHAFDRELRIDGDFSFKFGAPLRVSASSVRLANPDWADNPIMVEAEQVAVAIDPWTILGSQALILEDLEMTRLEGELVRDESGRANWDFGSAVEDSGADFLLRELSIRGATVTIRRPDEKPLVLEIAALRQAQAPDGLLQTTLRGTLQGRAIDASGRLGPFQNLLRGKDVRVALKASLGKLRINGSGLIDDLANPRQPTARIELVAPDTVDIAELIGFEHTNQGDVELKLDIEPDGPGIGIRAEGRWADARIIAHGRVADLPNLDGIEMAVNGSGNDLRGALQPLDLKRLPDLPFSFMGAFTRHGHELKIDELAFNAGDFVFDLRGDMRDFPSLNNATLKLRVQGTDLAIFLETLGLAGRETGRFSLEGRLERSAHRHDEFHLEAETQLGRATLSGTLGPAPDYTGSRGVFRATGQSFRRLGDLLGLPGLPDQAFELGGQLERLADGYRIIDDGTLVVGESSLRVTGVLGAQPLQKGTELSWALTGLDIAEVSAMPGLSMKLPSRSLDVAGHLVVDPEAIALDRVEGTLNSVAFSLEGQLGRDQAWRGSDLRVAIRGPQLQHLNFLAGDLPLPAGAFDASGRIQRTAKGLRVSESQIHLAGARGRVDGEIALPVSPLLQLRFDVALEGPDASGILKDHIDVELPSVPFQVVARGALSNESWQIDGARVKLGTTETTLSGVAERPGHSGVFHLSVESPAISEPGGWYGVELPDTRLRLTGTLERDHDTFRLNEFHADTDKGDLSGNLTYVPGTPPRIEGDLRTTGFDLSAPAVSSEPQDSKADEPLGGAHLIPDWPLPLERLRQVDAKLAIHADSIKLQRLTRANFDLDLVLEDGTLELAPLSFSGVAGSLEAELSLKPLTVGAEVSLSLIAEELYSDLLFPGLDNLNLVPSGNWNVELRSNGSTLRELAANLNGIGKLKTSGGRVPNTRSSSMLYGALFSNVIRTINPFFESDPYTEVVCAVLPFTFTEGLMASAPTVVAQTDKLNILSSGTIDLRTEELDLEFRTEARQGLGISAASVTNPFIRIGGTLAEPAVTLNRRGALVSGGAALLTGGLSLLAQAALGGAFRSSDPCESVLAESQKYFAPDIER
jgi:uncharacterized protein involved in outer membrane biogenesis